MKITKPLLVLCSITLVVLLVVQCKDGKGDKDAATTVTPVQLPSNIVPGFKFPENADTINAWVNDPSFPNGYDSLKVYQHAWGIWAGLTEPTKQTYAGDNLLVFETWLGLNDIYELVKDGKTDGGCEGTAKRQGRAMLTRPKQLEHAEQFATVNASKLIAEGKISAVKKQAVPKTFTEENIGFWVTVSYSPDAACYATKNQILKQSVINKYYTDGGLGKIPDFPNTSITIKPTYMIFHDTTKVLMKMPAWITAPNPADSNFFGNAQYCVYIDRDNKQPANKKVVPIPVNDSLPEDIKKATCNLNDFIHFRVDQKMASFMNSQDSVQGMNNSKNAYGKAKAGEMAVLVAMHVTSKEITNWTWQTFYWAADPDNPGSPSSLLAARCRPDKYLKGAAAHYAANAAYVMTTPNNSSSKTAGSMFGYNPYLEGGFGPTTFGITNNFNPTYQYGTQTNCMSCHAMAVASPHGQYTTDQFVNLKEDSLFRNEVSLDFAWSIQTGLIKDTIPYWKFKKK